MIVWVYLVDASNNFDWFSYTNTSLECLLKQFHIYILTFLVWVHKSCLIFKDIDIKS